MRYPNADFVIRQGDTAPRITGRIVDGLGAPVDASQATSVLLHLRGLTVTDSAVLDASPGDDPGDVHYDFEGQDLPVAGYYAGVWRVTFANSQVQSFPNQGHFLVQVSADIAVPA